MSPGNGIIINEVSKRFNTVPAVTNVSLAVPEGTICGLIGSDGAGKSTLLRMTATMIPPDSGSITIDGNDVTGNRERVKGITGYMPQRFGLYQDLTVRENMQFFVDIFGIRGKERERRMHRFLSFSNLLPFTERRAGNLSGGMKQKLGLACVLVHQPRFLILDEPTNGVDPVSRGEFWNILMDMKKAGMTLLLSTAYIDEGARCDMVALMHRSRIVDTGPPEQVSAGHASLEDALIDRIMKADGELANDTFATQRH